MPLDGITSHFLAKELDAALCGLRLDKLRQPARYDLLLSFRGPGAGRNLYLSANPSAPALYLTDSRNQGGQDARRFCLYLRKHLAGNRLLSVETVDFERVFRLEFEGYDKVGDRERKTLLCELMGRHSNLILLNHAGLIMEALVHVDSSINRMREVLPARPYMPPPKQDKLSPAEALARLRDETHGASALWCTLPGEAPLKQSLLALFAGFSPQLIAELLDRADIDPRQGARDLDSAAWLRLNRAALALLSAIVEARLQPAVYFDPENPRKVIDFHALRLNIGPTRPFYRVSEAVAFYYEAKDESNRFAQQRDALRKTIQGRLKYWERKALIHRQDLEESQGYQRCQEEGELILAYMHELKPGMDGLDCPDFHHENRPCHIKLNPSRSPSWNAQVRFRRYTKLKNKQKSAAAFLVQDLSEIDYLSSLLDNLAIAESSGDLALIKDEMRREDIYGTPRGAGHAPDGKPAGSAARTGKERSASGASAKRAAPDFAQRKAGRIRAQAGNRRADSAADARTVGPREFVSSDGLRILIGRNNLQNDKLTLKRAKKDDLWFHVQHAPGSHLILQISAYRGADIPERSLLEAAGLAAWFSRAGKGAAARGAGGKVAVDYCPAENVHKPNGARPGMVVYEHYRTIQAVPLNPDSLNPPPNSDSPDSGF